MATLDFLTKISAVLFIGLVMGLIAKKSKLPSMLFLILSGVVINNIRVEGIPIIAFNQEFLISASILALVMIVFKDSSYFSIKDLDNYTEAALKVAVIFLIMNLLFLSIGVLFLFRPSSVMVGLVFAAVMAGTDPAAVLSLFANKSNKITEILKFESVINTPITVLIPFILIDIIELNTSAYSSLADVVVPFLQQIITGIGTGVFIGLIVFRFMRKFYSDRLSPLTLITAALLAYILAETMNGNGVLSVTVLGVFFGNVTVKKKEELQEFSVMLSNILQILVFVLIGFLIPLDISPLFFLKSIILFGFMIFLRFASIHLVFFQDHVNLKEQIFMSLNCTKGIAVAVVAFIIGSSMVNIPEEIIQLMVLFIIFSVILSSIAAKFSQSFIRLKVEG